MKVEEKEPEATAAEGRLARLVRWRDRALTTPGVLWTVRASRSVRAVALRMPRYANQTGPKADALFLTLGAAVGLIGAIGVHYFFDLIDLANDFLVQRPMSIDALSGRWIVLPILTGGALALAAWIMRRIGHGRDGLNIPDLAHAVSRGDGHLPTRPALAKSLASAVTIGGGGSAGSEGPVAVLGATLASVFARPLRLRPARVRVLVGAGAAAGISATFSAPLAGAFFALEEILRSSSTTAFAPVVVSSVVAYASSLVLFGADAPFPEALTYGYSFYREVFIFFPIVGAVTGLLAGAFVLFEDRVAKARWRHRTPPRALPWLGGAAVGILMVAGQGYITSRGHFTIDFEALAQLSWGMLLFLALAKIAATVLTLNSGGSGGVFAPSLVIGAIVGTAIALILEQLLPSLPLTPGSYALAGMGSLVAAATGAPITAILLVFEISEDQAILLPLMLSVVVSVTVRRMLTSETLYSAWLKRTGRQPAGKGGAGTGEWMAQR